jgi:hypothetical protein
MCKCGWGAGDSERERGGETRFGAVPIAFEIESNGRIGRDTGKEGIRRGKVADVGEGEEGAVVHAYEEGDVVHIPVPRNTEFEDWTLRVGMLEKTGSRYDESHSFGGGFRGVESLKLDRASSSEELLFEDALVIFEDPEAEGLEEDCECFERNVGFPVSVMAEVGVIGESPVEDSEDSESTEESESVFVLVVSARGEDCKSMRRLDVRGCAEAVVCVTGQPELRNGDLNNKMNDRGMVTGLEIQTHSWLAMPIGVGSSNLLLGLGGCRGGLLWWILLVTMRV